MASSSSPSPSRSKENKESLNGREVAALAERMTAEIHKVVIGQESVVEQLLICLFSRGHGLLVGVPGLAKTLLVSTVSRVMQLSFQRIQFTPDLMPSDITGTDILQEDAETGKRKFQFAKGPIFAHLILADEINRTPPKTQAALLEAMQEQHVTVNGKTYQLPHPFFVLATQNPIEQEGTYALPEAQQDRFMFTIRVDYPNREDEIAIMKATTALEKPKVEAIVQAEQLLQYQEQVRLVVAGDHIFQYAADIVRATRPREAGSAKFINEWLNWGAGPRASQHMILGGKARALLRGRLHVTTEDIREVAVPVLRHRLQTTFAAEADGITAEKVIDRILEYVPLPHEEAANKARKS